MVLVFGITKTTSRHHDILNNVGNHHTGERFHLRTYDELKGQSFRDVVFCAPPSGSTDYAGAVKDASSQLWAGMNSGGKFIFTSAGSVFEGVTEASMTTDTPRAKRLVDAECAARSQGAAIILRLAGLYLLERGAHSYWLRSGKDVDGRSDGIINLLHYDDAAGACLAALLSDVNDGTFLISDGNPCTRQEICEVALKTKMFSDCAMPKFLGTESDPKGKVYDGSWSQGILNWKPKYASFEAFMSQYN
jgi:nucleoside-diphosphate-sugar epimerase